MKLNYSRAEIIDFHESILMKVAEFKGIDVTDHEAIKKHFSIKNFTNGSKILMYDNEEMVYFAPMDITQVPNANNPANVTVVISTEYHLLYLNRDENGKNILHAA